jgi:hypothetical protein
MDYYDIKCQVMAKTEKIIELQEKINELEEEIVELENSREYRPPNFDLDRVIVTFWFSINPEHSDYITSKLISLRDVPQELKVKIHDKLNCASRDPSKDVRDEMDVYIFRDTDMDLFRKYGLKIYNHRYERWE